MMTIDTIYGKLIIDRNNKHDSQLFYKFVPTKEFDIQMKNIMNESDEWQKELEKALNKKLKNIYSYE